ADGTSPLGGLPSLQGTVNGRVLAGDAATGVSSASVRFKSRNIFFGRTQFLSSGSDGSFSAAAVFNDFGSSRPVPVDGFLLQATHPSTGVVAPDVLGSFPTGQTIATQDIVFSNTGLVQGTVRRHTGALVNGGQVQASGPVSGSATIAADATYIV